MVQLEKACYCAKLASSKKAENIIILDMRELMEITDYFVICDGESTIQTKAIADIIIENLEQKRIKMHHIEGYNNGKWILLDYIDVIIHIFLREVRRYYNLEELWADAKKPSCLI